MTDKNLYILKQPTEAEPYNDDIMAVTWQHVNEVSLFSNLQFDQNFQPLDVESLTTQLETIIDNLYSSAWADGHCQEFTFKEKRITLAVAEVLELIGIGTKDKQ